MCPGPPACPPVQSTDLTRQRPRWGTKPCPRASRCPGWGCRVSAGPTWPGSGRWLVRPRVAAGTPGWGWGATPCCTDSWAAPHSAGPGSRTPPPPRSRTPGQAWPCCAWWDCPWAFWVAPQGQRGHPQLGTYRYKCRAAQRCLPWPQGEEPACKPTTFRGGPQGSGPSWIWHGAWPSSQQRWSSWGRGSNSFMPLRSQVMMRGKGVGSGKHEGD